MKLDSKIQNTCLKKTLMKKYVMFACINLSIVTSFGQNYNLFGDAQVTPSFNNTCPSDTCFTLTPDLLWKTGAVFSNELFDLTKPFDGTFCLFLGTKDATGADGFAFVLKDTNATNAALTGGVGGAGGGIGYGALSPSVAIEFDTWDNGGNDIPADHTSLHYNGNSALSVVPAISLSSIGANVEDGLSHTARIVWTPGDTTLSLYFDNVLRFSHRVDLRNTIFGGKSKVNWGFTCSTGGSSNLQQICFPVQKPPKLDDTLPPIPNVFTPNLDGINDFFTPVKDYVIATGELKIYNRWGNIVFETNDRTLIKKGWDGRQNGKLSSDGVYYFTFSYSTYNNKTTKNIAGSFHLFK